MSRSGYSDEGGAGYNLYRGRVGRAINGKRGQAFIRELRENLLAMPVKELVAGAFSAGEGEFCALGVVAKKRGLDVSDLGDSYNGVDNKIVGERFGIAPCLAAEIMYENDEYVSAFKWQAVEICGPVRPYYPEYGRHILKDCVPNDDHADERYQRMLSWCNENLKAQEAAK